MAVIAVAGHSSASADGIHRDTSNITIRPFPTELMAIPEPTYTKDVLVGSPWSRNWFASAAVGTSAFIGSPIGCEDLFGRLQPTVQVTAGKWFTPGIGVRVGYQGFKFTDADITDHDYHHAHADLMWNVVGMDNKDELGLHRWTVAPYVGGGIIHHEDNGKVPFTINYGVMAAYRINRRLSANMELAGLTTFKDFDGQGEERRFGDHMLTLSAGLTVNIGNVGWKRAVDANPYRQQNEYLRNYINDLFRDKKKSEPMLIAGGHGQKDDGEYSGLASLRARLAHKDWNGRGSAPSDTVAGQTADGRKLIGVPFYFFFKINTAELTDQSQLQNLVNLARVARAYHLDVYIDGAADAATGTEPVNASLSEQRARYVAHYLHEQGVEDSTIHLRAKGGIDKFSPIERNRHTRVMVKSAER